MAVRNALESQNFIFVSVFPPGHFYSPIPDLAQIKANAGEVFDRSARSYSDININEAGQLQLLGKFANRFSEIPFSDKKNQAHRYYFDNPYFSYGDGIILYSILRHFKPRQVVEVGSGFSSAAMMDVNDLFFKKQIRLAFIEPFPERLHGLLSEADRSRYTIETMPVQQVPLGAFTSLEANDILFIDSSHVGKTNSDVLHLLFRVLPLLRQGVIVHFHDILWPFEYPQKWIEEGRAWNEAYLLRAFLQYNSAFEVSFFNSFMACHHAGILARSVPDMLKVPSAKETIGNSSLWLRKIG